MSRFLDELFDDLEEPENDHTDDTAAIEIDHDDDDAEETPDDGVTEEIEAVEAEPEASEETPSDDDDETELTPVERKAYGRLKALQDERTKRQTAEAERDKANAQLTEMRRQQQEAAAQNLPDAYEDPQGYIAAREAQFQNELIRQSLGNSLDRAIEKHGEEEVQAAAAWFESQMASNPHIPLRENMLSQRDQMEYVLTSYKQARKVEALTNGDYSALIADLEKAGYSIARAETPTATAPAASVSPRVVTPSVTPQAQAAPAAPKRSKLAGSAGSTTATPKSVSMMDAVLRR